jgi:hypothetical protein
MTLNQLICGTSMKRTFAPDVWFFPARGHENLR